jgi:hypothetical protein
MNTEQSHVIYEITENQIVIQKARFSDAQMSAGQA